jgi:hypothetical protein
MSKEGIIKPISKLDFLIDENNQLISIFVISIDDFVKSLQFALLVTFERFSSLR